MLAFFSRVTVTLNYSHFFCILQLAQYVYRKQSPFIQEKHAHTQLHPLNSLTLTESVEYSQEDNLTTIYLVQYKPSYEQQLERFKFLLMQKHFMRT